MVVGENLRLRNLVSTDSSMFREDGATLRAYLKDLETDRRWIRVAELQSKVIGYVTLLWVSDDPVLRTANIPEISDLKVLAPFRRRGVGSALLDEVEAEAATHHSSVGLHVGLHSGYGSAQRLYVRRGYLPDGAGVVVEGTTVPEGATVRLDDNPIASLRMIKNLSNTPSSPNVSS